MIKQINRMKVLSNQALGRQVKTEVLNDNLQLCERKVESIKQACHATNKKLKDCLQGSGNDIEKRQKKLPYYILSQSMVECSQLFDEESILGEVLSMSAEACSQVSLELTSHEMGLENLIIIPFSQLLDTEFPKIEKLRRRLNKLTLDLDSSKSKYTASVKAFTNQASPEHQSRVDAAKEEMDDANIKMEQCKDQLANEMMSVIAREPECARSLIDMVSAQAQYHRNALARLEVLVPKMMDVLEQNKRKPVYGLPLEEHLDTEGVKIAVPLQTCVDWLLEFGIDEEGLFRIAGSASKVKVLRSALNAGVELPIHDFMGHEHAITGTLKQYLRELPEPLLTFELYDDLVDAQCIKDNSKKLETLWNILHRLPPANKANFEFLVRFLYKVSLKSDKNKMGASNLALVIGPNVMWSETEQGVSAATMGVASSILESFITNAPYFFPEKSPNVEFITPSIPSLQNGDVPKSPELPALPPTSPSQFSPPQAVPSPTPPPPHRQPPQVGVTATDGGKPPSIPQSQAQRLQGKAGTIPRRSSKKAQAPLPPGPPGSAGNSPSPSPTGTLTRQNNLEPSPLAASPPPVLNTNEESNEKAKEEVQEVEKDPQLGEDEMDSVTVEVVDQVSSIAHNSSNNSLDNTLSTSEDGSLNPFEEDMEEPKEVKPHTPPVKEKPPRPVLPRKSDNPPTVAAKPIKPERPPDSPSMYKAVEKPERPDRPHPPNVKPDRPKPVERGSAERKSGHKPDVKEKVQKPQRAPPVPKNPPTKRDNTSKSIHQHLETGAAPLSPPPSQPRSPAFQRPRVTPPPPPKEAPAKEEPSESTHL